MPTGEKITMCFFAVTKDGKEIPIKELQEVTMEEAEGTLGQLGFIKPVMCKDCRWYTRPHISYNDGTKQYFDTEKEMPLITSDIGTFVGGQCIGHKTYCTAHDREDPDDYEELVVFRNTDDWCSYGERE